MSYGRLPASSDGGDGWLRGRVPTLHVEMVPRFASWHQEIQYYPPIVPLGVVYSLQQLKTRIRKTMRWERNDHLFLHESVLGFLLTWHESNVSS